MDSDEGNVESIKQEDLSWKYNLTAARHFVSKDNVNRIFADNGFTGEIGLLSVDVDGNDYWIWEAIDTVTPEIVIVEYNATFGHKHPVTIPYQKEFFRTNAHFSNVYYGTSLRALYRLALRKGYSFVGCNRAGNNAYFVRNDKIERLSPLSPLSPEEGFVMAGFRESKDEAGRATFLSFEQRLDLIGDMPVWDVEQEKMFTIKALVRGR
jgi:hypothetical protein